MRDRPSRKRRKTEEKKEKSRIQQQGARGVGRKEKAFSLKDDVFSKANRKILIRL